MNWITVVWSMIVGACLSVALIYFVSWLQQVGKTAYLAFAVTAASLATVTFCELLLMRAQSPGEFGTILRWAHIPVFTLFVSMVVFVRIYLDAGRLWLAWSVCGLRLLALLLNFQSELNLNYLAITGLQQLPLFGGESVAVAVGVENPWTRIGALSSLLLLFFLADASYTCWRRGGEERRRAMIIGGSLVFWIVVAGGNSALLHAGVIHSIYLLGLPFLAVVAAIGYQLGADRQRADQLTALLKQERAFLRQVIDITPNLIFAKDRQGRFTLVNQAVADIYGTTIDSLVGKTDADFSANMEEVERFRRADIEVMDSLQEQFIAEEEITDANGTTHWLQTVKRPVLDQDGVATQVLGASTDITARRQAELELGRQRNEVAHLSRVTILSELSGSLAHELNQPLTAILSNAQAAQRFMACANPDLAEVRDILQDIVDDDKRAGEVIKGLRLLLKKGEMRREALDINRVAKETVRLMRSDLLNDNVAVTLDLAPDLPAVLGDQVQLQQVLLNLLMNGCEIMLDGAESNRNLTIATMRDEDNSVRVTVTDSGPGIHPDNLEKVFEPFFTTKPQGLGLGLQVSRRIINAHDGRLWATNAATRGACFHFTIPANSTGAG